MAVAFFINTVDLFVIQILLSFFFGRDSYHTILCQVKNQRFKFLEFLLGRIIGGRLSSLSVSSNKENELNGAWMTSFVSIVSMPFPGREASVSFPGRD